MKKLLTSFFGLGFLPIAPGTWGSLPPVVAYQALAYIVSSGIIGFWVLPASQILLLIAGSWICVACSPAVIAATGDKDPKHIVADEVAGQSLTMLIICIANIGCICNTTVLGFIMFRLFDITKPWPIRKLEKLPQGWGILADDLLAGIYAGIASLILIHLIPSLFA